MAKTKEYKIVINGLSESVKAVDALNKSLDALDSKIKSLEGKVINVGAKVSAVGSSGSKSSLSEEEKLAKQIEQIDAKREAYSKEIYQNYLAAKDVLKETVQDQKSIVASERLQAKKYTNTIQGMKQELSDIKAAMQTVDLGDGDQLDKMVKRANELNESLKKVEESYGQFGRNVGNYASAADGFKKLTIEVDGVTKEFDTAKQALKELRAEMQTLSAKKDMGLISEEEEKRLKGLIPVVAELKSSIEDAGKPMDALMDGMKSVLALAQTGKGLAAFFGIDGEEINRSIQKLVALQNAMQGLQTIQNQLQSKEGIGSWLAKGSDAVDKLVDSIFGVEKASKAATTASKALGTALKAIGIGVIIAGVVTLINLLEKWTEKQNEAAEEAEKAAEKIQKAVDEQRQAYVGASATYMNTASRLSYLRTEYQNTNNELRKTNIIKEAAAEFKKLGMNIKGVNDAQRIFVNDGDKVIQLLKLQGDAAAISALRMEAFKKSFQMLLENGYDANAASILAGNNKTVLELDKRLGVVTDQVNKIKGELKIGIDSIGRTIEKGENTLHQLKLRLMKDGLNKTLMQLTEEERQTINKIKENGVKVQQMVKQTEETYAQLRIKAINDYLLKLTKTVEDYSKKIASIRFQINTKDIELQIKKIDEEIRSITSGKDIAPINNTLVTKSEYELQTADIKKDDLYFANVFNYEKNKANTEKEIEKYHKWLDEYVKTLSEEIKREFYYENLETGELAISYEKVEDYIEEHYKKELKILASYGYLEEGLLKKSFEFRLNALMAYNEEYLSQVDDALKEEEKLRKKAADIEEREAFTNNKKQYDETVTGLKERQKEIENSLSAIEKLGNFANKIISYDFKKENEERIKQLEKDNGIEIKTYKDYYEALKEFLIKNQKETNKQIAEARKQFADNVNNISKEHGQQLIEIENEIREKRRTNAESYYYKQINNYRDFLSKINDETAKQPVVDTAGFGIVNIVQSKRNYREILAAAKTTFENIQADREKLNESFKNGLISPENYNAILNQLNDLENDTRNTFQTVTENYKKTNGDFFQSIQMYIQETITSFQTIMNAVWDAEDTAFDKEQEQLDKQNDAIQEALDKQQDIIEEHKNAIDSIEDELANSRGDRRQHLIDQINAEIEAERNAQKEKQRLEKQEEANKKKQEALELKRKKAEYNRQIMQAIVNGAQAVTMAAINTWPIPAIPMMSLAAATTAAQIAIMQANKPYRVGGQLEGGLVKGKRHTQGGVPVGNTGIEVEGDEMIIRRESTIPNIDLLNFINKSQRKIDINDLIDFYSSGKVKKNIQSMSPKTKYADGGALPSLSYNYDINDRLITSFEQYANKPTVVQVVDIINRTEAVKNVQVLAGLSE